MKRYPNFIHRLVSGSFYNEPPTLFDSMICVPYADFYYRFVDVRTYSSIYTMRLYTRKFIEL